MAGAVCVRAHVVQTNKILGDISMCFEFDQMSGIEIMNPTTWCVLGHHSLLPSAAIADNTGDCYRNDLLRACLDAEHDLIGPIEHPPIISISLRALPRFFTFSWSTVLHHLEINVRARICVSPMPEIENSRLQKSRHLIVL